LAQPPAGSQNGNVGAAVDIAKTFWSTLPRKRTRSFTLAASRGLQDLAIGPDRPARVWRLNLLQASIIKYWPLRSIKGQRARTKPLTPNWDWKRVAFLDMKFFQIDAVARP
jgi:hypothetical protein